jgi:hypothetical protein
MEYVIDPRIEVIDYGPVTTLPDGTIITSDEWICGASQTTYRGMNALAELADMKRGGIVEVKGSNPIPFSDYIRKSLVASAGRGHASMATSMGMWVVMSGCSKLVDSIFTSARFGSSIMPSGRRVGIPKEDIVMPRAIAESPLARKIYLEAAEKNIEAYEKLKARESGVLPEEAAKLVHYGHAGGGFMFMPLETIISFVREAENLANASFIPDELRTMAQQMADFAKKSGMEVTYEARKAAPRAGIPNPNIFHNRINAASERIAGEGYSRVLYEPEVELVRANFTPVMMNRIEEYLEERNRAVLSLGRLGKSQDELLYMLETLCGDYPNALKISTTSNVPWRVWGEIKRHRTLPQVAEPIYHAADRAVKSMEGLEKRDSYSDESLLKNLSGVMSLPPSVVANPNHSRLWVDTFKQAMMAYRHLTEIVEPKDAVFVIPRGIKMIVEKELDPFNAFVGYMPLRLCGTAEPEIQRVTREELARIRELDIPESAKDLIGPKCHAVGFCLEPTGKYGSCRRVNAVNPDYDSDSHHQLEKERKERILSKLEK